MEQKANEDICLIIHNEYSDCIKDLDSDAIKEWYGEQGVKNAPESVEFFEKLKQTVQKNPAYLDKSANVKITDYKIQFNISVKEINYIFPEIAQMLRDRFPKNKFGIKSFSEENIKTYGCNQYIKIHVPVGLSSLQKSLNEDAKNYFHSQKFQPVSKVEKNRLKNKKPGNVLFELLENNQGLVLGESYHSNISGKRLLIDNFVSLKKAGVTHLFIEHLLADTQTHLLEEYFDSKDAKMPKALESYLNGMNKDFKLEDKQYNFSQLIVAAKEAGIRVVPIDTSVSYSTDSSVYLSKAAEADRYRMMNYVFAKQFEKYKIGSKPPLNKFIVFCGSGHAKELSEGIPGVSEITGCPAVVIRDIKRDDKGNNKEESIVVNPEIDIEPTKSDVLMIVDPEKSLAHSSEIKILKTESKIQFKEKADPANTSSNNPNNSKLPKSSAKLAPTYTNHTGKIDLSNYKRVKNLTNGLTNEVWLWEHNSDAKLKIVVKTPKEGFSRDAFSDFRSDARDLVRNNIKSINAFFGDNSAWLIESNELQFAMKYYEGERLSLEEKKTLIDANPSPLATVSRNGLTFTMLDVKEDNFLKLPGGEIVPIDHDYMVIHDGSDLLGYQKAQLNERSGAVYRSSNSPEFPVDEAEARGEALDEVLDNYLPEVRRYLYEKWGQVDHPHLKSKYSSANWHANAQANAGQDAKATQMPSTTVVSFTIPKNLRIPVSTELENKIQGFAKTLNQGDVAKNEAVVQATQTLIDEVLGQFVVSEKPFDNDAFEKAVKTYEETVTNLSLQQKLFIAAMTFLGALVGFVLGAVVGAAISGLNPIAAVAVGVTGAVVGGSLGAGVIGGTSFGLARFGVFKYDPVKNEATELLDLLRKSCSVPA